MFPGPMASIRLLFVYISLLLSVPVFAGPATIGGTVKNKWGDSLVGTNVRIVGQPLLAVVGAMNGSYELGKVPPGMHDILYTQPAYDTLLVRHVPVDHDTVLVLHVILSLPEGNAATCDTVYYTRLPEDSVETTPLEDSSGVEEK